MNQSRRVLLIDDNQEILHGASLRLRAAGFETVTTTDGLGAVATAVETQPDAIVLDVKLEDQDGLSALAELQSCETTKNIPIVMLSASVADQQRALEAGARFFLRKPYQGKTLLAAVRTAVSEANPTRTER